MTTEPTTVIVLVKGNYGNNAVHFTADDWRVSAAGRLTVYAAGGVHAADFDAGQWLCVIDDRHRQPDLSTGALKAAQRALALIHEGCATGNMTFGQIARIAADGLMEVNT